LIEAVADSKGPNQLAFCTSDGKATGIRRAVQHHGCIYIPQDLGPGLGKAVGFPTDSFDFGSPAELVSDLKLFFSKYAELDARTANVLSAFALATWFIDCFEVAPVLYLHGPDHEVSVVMRVLSCICYHPVLLSDLDITALRTLPAGLRVTLLINQGDLGRQVEKALLASTRRHFVWARGKQPMDFFGAHVLRCDSPAGQIGLSVWINPTRLHFPNFTEAQERAMAGQFQSRLLAYRMSCHARVRNFEIEAGATHSGMEDQLQTWDARMEAKAQLISNSAPTAMHYEVRAKVLSDGRPCQDLISKHSSNPNARKFPTHKVGYYLRDGISRPDLVAEETLRVWKRWCRSIRSATQPL